MATPNACSFVRYEQCPLLHRLACVGCVSGRAKSPVALGQAWSASPRVSGEASLLQIGRWLSSACCGGRVCVLTWLSRAFYPTKLVMVGWLVGNTHTKILMGSGTYSKWRVRIRGKAFLGRHAPSSSICQHADQRPGPRPRRRQKRSLLLVRCSNRPIDE